MGLDILIRPPDSGPILDNFCLSLDTRNTPGSNSLRDLPADWISFLENLRFLTESSLFPTLRCPLANSRRKRSIDLRGRLEFGVLPMSKGISVSFLFQVPAKSLGELDVGLIGQADQHEEHISQLISQIRWQIG